MSTSVFIHGIARRSGTNLLHQTLLLHPQVVDAANVFKEDWFLAESDSLNDFVDAIWKHWKNPRWQVSIEIQQSLSSALGEGLLLFLQKQLEESQARFFITKTPKIDNIDRFQRFFPQSKHIILVRDPRDVAASAFRTWQKSVRISLDEWDAAARELAAYEQIYSNYLLIRYEDLLLDSQSTLQSILDYLQLDGEAFPWSDFKELGVFGSSENGWGYQSKTDSFKPIGRWKFLPDDDAAILCQARSTWDYLGYAQELNPLPSLTERQSLNIKVEHLDSRPEHSSHFVDSVVQMLKSRLKWLMFALLGPDIAKSCRSYFSQM